MIETAIATAFRKAGGNPNRNLLYAVAIEQLRAAGLSPNRAIGHFLEEVRDAPALALELIPPEALRAYAHAYLGQRALEMRNQSASKDDQEMTGEGGAQSLDGRHDSVSAPSPVASSEGDGAQFMRVLRPVGRPSPSDTQAEDAHGMVMTANKVLARSSAPIPEKAGGLPHRRSLTAAPRIARPPASPQRTLEDRKRINSILSKSYFDSIKLRNGCPIGDLPWSAIDRLVGENAYEAELLKLVRNYGQVSNPSTPIRNVVPVAVFERMVQKAAELTNA